MQVDLGGHPQPVQTTTIDFKDSGVTITGERYCERLKRLLPAIKAERPGQLRNELILLPDKARSHIANVVTQK